MSLSLMRKIEVLEAVHLGRTQLDYAIQRGEFPRPIKITESGRRVAWIREEVDAFIAGRAAARSERSKAA